MAKRMAMPSLGAEYSARVVRGGCSVLRRLYANGVDVPKKQELLQKHLACVIERVEPYGTPVGAVVYGKPYTKAHSAVFDRISCEILVAPVTRPGIEYTT